MFLDIAMFSPVLSHTANFVIFTFMKPECVPHIDIYAEIKIIS